ncbi:hypothetical protein EBZ80_12715 [bacterium]|nr:hypothetical protein [bacterium]
MTIFRKGIITRTGNNVRATVIAAMTLPAATGMAATGELNREIAARPVTSSPLRIGAGLDAGAVSVKSQTPAELDKTGPAYGVKGFVELRSRYLSLMVGATQQSSNLKGEDATRGLGQQMTVNSAIASAGLLLNFTPRFSVGFVTRTHKGPSADYGVYPDNEVKTYRDTGTTVRAGLPFLKNYDLSAEVSAFRATKTEDRNVNMVIAGLSASIPVKIPNFGRIELAAKKGPEAGKPETIDDIIRSFPALYFKHASNELEAASETKVAEIVKILKGKDLVKELGGRQIQIDGHGTQTGGERWTMKLSVDRAEKIAAMLVAGGIPQESLAFTGYGSSMLDPRVEPRDERQRRVVFALASKDDGTPASDSATSQISTTRAPAGVVYRVDELWTILEMSKSLFKFRDSDKKVIVDVPYRVTQSPGTWEKVHHAIASFHAHGIKSNQLIVKSIVRKGGILLTVASPDEQLVAEVERTQRMRKNLIVLPVSSEKVSQMAIRLRDNQNLWTRVEARPEIRDQFIEAGLKKSQAVRRVATDLWPRTTGSYGLIENSDSVIIIHARRSKDTLAAALVGAGAAPVAAPAAAPVAAPAVKAPEGKKPARTAPVKAARQKHAPETRDPWQVPGLDLGNPLAH